ncbi:MAG TPA: phosphatidate cytidylyltransferase [Ignavibacteria bacterium]
MNLPFLIIVVLFVIGGLGFLIINRKLSPAGKKENWIKYFTYLLIVIIVLGSILINKKIFVGLIICISSVGIMEMMLIGKKSEVDHSVNRIILISLSVFSILLFFFFLFVLLPETIIAYTYIIVLVFDGASQVIGQLAGKNKIVPEISPNKTWEGFIGGMIIAIITSVLLHKSGGFTISQSLIFGLIVCLSSFAGDLLASRFKRILGAKNFSNILPGQGGMFDRFDSFLSSGAMIGLLGIPYLSVNYPNKDIAVYLVITFLFLIILIIGELLHYSLKIKPEFSRMLSHFFAGIIILLFIQLFSSPWYVFALCFQSAAFLIETNKMGFLDSHHKVNRKTSGSSFFFLGILIAYLVSVWTEEEAYFILPILIVTISDPFAAVAGLNYKSGYWTNILTGKKSSKTNLGSYAFFVSSSVLLFSCLPVFYDLNLMSRFIISITISLIVTFIEAISSNGFDNLTIPGSVIVLLFLTDYLFI